AQLHLLHVLEDPIETAAFATRTFVPDLPEVREARLREAADRLAQRAGADSTPPRVTTEVVVGASARTIAEYADTNGFDLIAMGTHGRTGIAHLVMGSVAEQVVRTAPCPVLSTRYPNRYLNSSSNP
ncbi:MAG: universal stress protein, partial [Acidobacteria bacterium]|nr:universal stress protein [Acidobacteriota bacterium]